MKQTLTDANFPRTADLRVYHLGLRPGEVANRIVTVGSPSRAYAIAAHFDAAPAPRFELASERGFLTLTGRYKGVPLSVVSIGMGHPNVDFFVREVRECLAGDMLIVRLGSCGALIDVPVGSVVLPTSSVAVERNLDFDFVHPETCAEEPYRISKPATPDAAAPIVPACANASADSFYSSQGRQTSFPDANGDLIARLQGAVPGLATFECWRGRPAALPPRRPPLATAPVRVTTASTSFVPPSAPSETTDKAEKQEAAKAKQDAPLAGPHTRIRAAAAQMVFAARASRAFITPGEVAVLEGWTGRGVLDALAATPLADDRVHPEAGSVWALSAA
ncbi:nucleoside phosphorylase domain-containing protein [Mycena sp. CBHHK59/15]|nr:nucleoside phosphorylase domain-containing protein [Mycena sp. CBHHK59/15]